MYMWKSIFMCLLYACIYIYAQTTIFHFSPRKAFLYGELHVLWHGLDVPWEYPRMVFSDASAILPQVYKERDRVKDRGELREIEKTWVWRG